MTAVRVSLIDLYVLRGAGPSLECLVLRRAPGGRCPGSWETVHGHIEPGERPAETAVRELQEETGLTPLRLYNLSRVELFYVHRADEVALVPVFVAFVAPSTTARNGCRPTRPAAASPGRASAARSKISSPYSARATRGRSRMC
jgi:8-oxo-dGTP pyrophosphatase MutT (NUDIX family)